MEAFETYTSALAVLSAPAVARRRRTREEAACLEASQACVPRDLAGAELEGDVVAVL